MGEAIFAKYSKSTGGGGGTINSSTIISNSTKAAFGLGPDATLDDCLLIVGLKNPDTATVQVTLKDIDGSPLGGHRIRMQDRTGFNLVYTTDGAGSCIFTTVNAQATFYDESNNGWFDVGYPNSGTIDLPNGMVKTVTLQRYKRLNNGDTITLNNSVRWYNFSKYTKSGNVYLNGCRGDDCFWKSGRPYTFNVWFNSYEYHWYPSFNLNKNGGNVTFYLSNRDVTTTSEFEGAGAGFIDAYISKAIGGNGESKWFNNVNLNGNFNFTASEIKIDPYVDSQSVRTPYFYGTESNNLMGTVQFLRSNARSGGPTSFGSMVSNGGIGGVVSVDSGNVSISWFYIDYYKKYNNFSEDGGHTFNYYPAFILMYAFLPNNRSGTLKGSGLISNFQYK